MSKTSAHETTHQHESIRRSLAISVSAVVTLYVLASCASRDLGLTPQQSVTDSSGVTVVTNYSPSWDSTEGWIVEEDGLEIGGDPHYPATLFGIVRSVGWMTDGRVFVADEQAHHVRVFSANGEYEASIGGAGDGPGELQQFMKVGRYRGDSLFVYDYRQRAVSIFDGSLQFARRVRNPVDLGNYWIVDTFSDGGFLLMSPDGGNEPSSSGLVPVRSAILTADPEGLAVDSIGWFRVTFKFFGEDGREEPLYLKPDGAIRAADNRLLWMEGSTVEYRVGSRDGTLERIVRVQTDIKPTTDEVVEEFREFYRTQLTADGVVGGMARVRRAFASAHMYPWLPATSVDMIVDSEDHVWLGKFRFTGQTTNQWYVFNPAGEWLGEVSTPVDLEIHEIGETRVLGVFRDSLDVAHVQVHRLHRRPRPTG